MKRIVQANIKRQKHQTSVKNVIFMSAKTVSSDIILIVNRKGNRLCDIFAMKVPFSSFYFVFRVFILFSEFLFCFFSFLFCFLFTFDLF